MIRLVVFVGFRDYSLSNDSNPSNLMCSTIVFFRYY